MSENLQVETAVSGKQDFTLNVGSRSPSFDELDGLEDTRSEFKEAVGVSEGKSEEAPTKSEASKVIDEATKAITEQDKPEDKKPEQPKQKKTIKAKLNESEFDYDPDAKISVKVNGEDQEVALQEILNNYSGKTDWTKKYTELDKEKKGFAKDREEFIGVVKQFGQKINGENIMEGIDFLVDQIGMSRYDVEKKLFAHYLNQFNELQNLSEAEQRAYWINKENEYLKSVSQSSAEKIKQEQTRRDSELKIQQLRETHGISKEDYESAFIELEKLGFNQAPPEKAIEYLTLKPSYDKAGATLEKINPKLLENDGLITEVANIYREFPNTSEQEIMQALGYVPKDDAKVLSQKVQGPGNSLVTKTVKADSDFESFRDYDEY